MGLLAKDASRKQSREGTLSAFPTLSDLGGCQNLWCRAFWGRGTPLAVWKSRWQGGPSGCWRRNLFPPLVLSGSPLWRELAKPAGIQSSLFQTGSDAITIGCSRALGMVGGGGWGVGWEETAPREVMVIVLHWDSGYLLPFIQLGELTRDRLLFPIER